jgi:hypothetical protein
MTLPDVRRLLQVIFAPEPPKSPVQHAIDLSDWRQKRNRIASECHAKVRKQMLRDTS